MSESKRPASGFVVDHKSAGVRYAVLPEHVDLSIHDVVRELKADESVISYKPRLRRKSGELATNPPEELFIESAKDNPNGKD